MFIDFNRTFDISVQLSSLLTKCGLSNKHPSKVLAGQHHRHLHGRFPRAARTAP